ncbi:hypothetical protein [Streptomyces sp. NPDC003717]|uniref:hypothetical protein n=1 Tax=Streptomyces sp. NPDC003717 TaxID=3154276 RepID=UPI0033AEACCA
MRETPHLAAPPPLRGNASPPDRLTWPFVWVDDEIGTMDHLWVAPAHPGPALLHRVDPTKDLQD